MKEVVNMIKSLICLFVMVLFCNTVNAQNNSPWRKINEEILVVKNVYFAPGCHQYSLTGGQGFSVYIKNQNTHSVFIKGKMIARTYCGTDIVSPFTVTLNAKGVSNGGSYDDPDNNGQASLVSPAECKGVGYTVKINKGRNTKARYITYRNRIKTVKVTNVEVIDIDTVTAKKKIEIPKPPVVVKKEEYDSLINQKLFWYQHVDSLTSEVRTLRNENNSLSDSLTYYKFMYNQQKSYIQIMQQPPAATTKKNKKKKSKSETTN